MTPHFMGLQEVGGNSEGWGRGEKEREGMEVGLREEAIEIKKMEDTEKGWQNNVGDLLFCSCGDGRLCIELHFKAMFHNFEESQRKNQCRSR